MITHSNEPVKYNQLVDAALVLFNLHGIKRVTVEEICQQADVSKMTFYKYFRNKENLVQTLINRIWDEAENKYSQIMEENLDFPSKISGIVALKIQNSRQFSSIFLNDIMGGVPGLKNILLQRYESFMQQMVDFFKSGQKSGHVRANIPEAFFPYILYKLLDLANDEALLAIFPDRAELAAQLTEYFFYGISAGERL